MSNKTIEERATPTQTGDKPMVTPELLPCPFCGGDEFLILSNTLIGEHSFWGVECGCHVFGPTATLRAEAIAAWNTRAQETLSPEQPLDTLQRLGQEFEQPTPTSRYYFCTADKTWYAKPCGDPWCRDANYQPKQGECNR